MSASRIVVVRHGRTAYNVERRIQGASDIELDQVGVQQARSAAPYLAQYAPTRILSSDLVRASYTAEFIGEATGRPVATSPALRERSYGQWEGLTGDEIEASWPELFLRWRRGENVPDIGMESRSTAGTRFATFVEAETAGMSSGTLCVVSHGGVSNAGIAMLLGLDPDSWFGLQSLANVHWAVLVPGSQQAWRLAEYNVGAIETGLPEVTA